MGMYIYNIVYGKHETLKLTFLKVCEKQKRALQRNKHYAFTSQNSAASVLFVYLCFKSASCL